MSESLWDKIHAALLENLRDATGDCTCDVAYIGRGMEDPYCGWHLGLPTTDKFSVQRVMDLVEAEVVPLLRDRTVLREAYMDNGRAREALRARLKEES